MQRVRGAAVKTTSREALNAMLNTSQKKVTAIDEAIIALGRVDLRSAEICMLRDHYSNAVRALQDVLSAPETVEPVSE